MVILILWSINGQLAENRILCFPATPEKGEGGRPENQDFGRTSFMNVPCDLFVICFCSIIKSERHLNACCFKYVFLSLLRSIFLAWVG